MGGGVGVEGVTEVEKAFTTSVYRKSTFSRVYTHF